MHGKQEIKLEWPYRTILFAFQYNRIVVKNRRHLNYSSYDICSIPSVYTPPPGSLLKHDHTVAKTLA